MTNQFRRIDTTFDMLSKAIIGVDRVIAQAIVEADDNYPPYNIVIVDDDNWIFEFAVAGFSKDEITITQNQKTLYVNAEKNVSDDSRNYRRKGIAYRKFNRPIPLADFVVVDRVTLVDGILSIALRKEIPEDQKPKTISID